MKTHKVFCKWTFEKDGNVKTTYFYFIVEAEDYSTALREANRCLVHQKNFRTYIIEIKENDDAL